MPPGMEMNLLVIARIMMRKNRMVKGRMMKN